jgi:excinuclease ABC subunit A
LHLSDCKRLIEVLHHLVDQGHSVLIIEHNTDLLAEMDWLIELGPEGGEKGGELLFQGNFETIKQCQESITSAYL